MLASPALAGSGRRTSEDDCSTSWQAPKMRIDVARGLVHEHISTRSRTTTAVVYPGGMVIRESGFASRPPPSSSRGDIYGFSESSRRRFRELLARLPQDGTYYDVVTLTYHNEWTASPDGWHRDLAELFRRMVRDWTDYDPHWVWHLEFQKRGAPHFHCLIQTVRPLGPLWPSWLARTWNAIVAPGDQAHLAAGTRAEVLRRGGEGGMRQVMAYLCKYTSKRYQARRLDGQTGEVLPTGRMWGKDEYLHLDGGQAVSLTDWERDELYARLRAWCPRSPYISRLGDRRGGALIWGDPQALLQLLEGLGGRYAAATSPTEASGP